MMDGLISLSNKQNLKTLSLDLQMKVIHISQSVSGLFGKLPS